MFPWESWPGKHAARRAHGGGTDLVRYGNEQAALTQSIAEIEAEANRRWPLDASLIIHRYGRLAPGDQIMMVATAAPHRGDAFAAAEFLMDYLKSRAPFWKKEITGEGAAWVAARDEAVGEFLGAATSPLWAFAAGRGGKTLNGIAPSIVMILVTIVAIYGSLHHIWRRVAAARREFAPAETDQRHRGQPLQADHNQRAGPAREFGGEPYIGEADHARADGDGHQAEEPPRHAGRRDGVDKRRLHRGEPGAGGKSPAKSKACRLVCGPGDEGYPGQGKPGGCE